MSSNLSKPPKSGDRYTYAGEEPFGNEPGAVQPGTKVTVREVVAADTIGAHNDTEDAVVLETDEGRAWSVGLELFALDYTKGH